MQKSRLCYTIYDFYADCLSAQTPQIIRKSIAFFEKLLIRFTDAVILVDKSRYVQIEGAKFNKIEYICNSPPDYNTVPQRQSTPDKSKFVLFYAGILHSDRGLMYVIDALQDLEDIQLIIAGTGPEKEQISKCMEGSDGKMHCLGYLPYDEVIRKSLMADMLFAFYDPSIPNNRYASPNKLFEAMMCGMPILTNEGTSMADIVQNEECGLVVPYGDVEAIRYAILTLKNDLPLCKRLGENGRHAYETKYDWMIMQKRLLNLYNEMCSGKRAT